MGNTEQEAEARAALLNKFGRDWTAFNSQVAGFPIPAQPELLSDDRANFRRGFMQEELDEFLKAHKEGDLDGVVDACIDLIYVTIGALGEMGVLVQPTWDEVQRANMAKRRGQKSTRPGSAGFDAIKPEGWTGPSHADYLTITSEDVQTLLEIRQSVAQIDLITKPQKAPAVTNVSVWANRPLVGAKLLIMGYARHGKDTVSELLRDRYGLTFTSSSQFCAERVILPAVKALWNEFNDDQRGRNLPVPEMPNYATAEQCFADRGHYRAFWFDTIEDHNTPDKTRLGREIFQENSVYCGIRSAREFHALKNAGVFDVAIWVDATERGVPVEDKSSCTVEPWIADYVLDNNGTLEDLERGLNVLMNNIFAL